MPDDIERFEELRFLYACGKLDAEPAAWMEEVLAAQPALAAGLDADRALVKAGMATPSSGLAWRRASSCPMRSTSWAK